MNGQPLDLHNLRSGDLVLVHLALKARDRVPDALVVDLLPAGLELENQNLAQSAASLDNASSAVKQWRESMQNASVVHQEYRDDRYVAALKLDSYGTTHLLYLARAVTPGTYRAAAAGGVDVPAEPAGGGRWARGDDGARPLRHRR
jgi:uncharacterized protein YfaS (alpha-2-macroglobulin family)